MRIPFTDYHTAAILKIYDEASLPIDLILRDYFKSHPSLGSKDRKIIGETLYQMIRYQSLIEFLASSQSPLEKLACLRKIHWNSLETNESIPEPIRYGMSSFLYQKMVHVFGKKQTQNLCQILNEQAPITIRANLMKTSREALLEKWASPYGAFPCHMSASAITFPARFPLFSFPEFKEGLFEMQDEGSQLVASLVTPSPGDAIFDFCSGSGGKTLAFAHLTQGKGQIYLHDVRPSALMEAKKRLKRAGIQNAQCCPPGHPQLTKIQKKCDWVLIDVPCSGSGTLRRNPDQKWKISQETFDRLTVLQWDIILQAITYLKPGGKLVFATCSIFPEENELQIERMLKELPLKLISPPLSLLPSRGGPDGFFGAILEMNKNANL